MNDKEYANAEDEAYARGIQLQQEWDHTLAEIEKKWGLRRGCTLDQFCLTFKGH